MRSDALHALRHIATRRAPPERDGPAPRRAAEEVAELERRERAGGIDVDGAAAAYMRATAVGGCRHSVGTEVRPRAARAARCPGS